MKPQLTMINRTRLELVFCTSKYTEVVIHYVPPREEGHKTQVTVIGVDYNGDPYYKDSFNGVEVSVTHYYHEIVVNIQKEN